MKRFLLVGLSLSFVLFTMAASITSTVAWFSSTRVAYTSAGNFEVVQIDGSMECDLYKGVGTKISADGKHVLVGNADPDIEYILLDSSVDLDTGHAYRLNRESSGYQDMGAAAESNWHCDTRLDDEGNTLWYYAAVSWTIDFKYTFRTESDDVGVYLNLKASTMSAQTPSEAAIGGHTEKSQYGFRIAFLPTGGGGFVFGNSSADPTTLRYVSGTTPGLAPTGSVKTYTASNYVTYGSDKPIYDDGPGHEDAPERICTLTRDNTHNLVTCIAWFEGEDPNVIHGTQMDIMNVELSFYVRSDA